MKQVLVTGATGKIGSKLIAQISNHPNIECCAFVRDRVKAKQLLPESTLLIEGDFNNHQSISEALKGIDTIVLITPANPNAVEQVRMVLNEASKLGVRKIIRVSVFKAAIDGPTIITRLHGQTDQEII